MLVILKTDATPEVRQRVCDRIRELGLTPHVSDGEFKTMIGAIGNGSTDLQDQLQSLDGVETVMAILKPYKLPSREFRASDSVFTVRGVKIGGPNIAIIAGPCAVESRDLVFDVGRRVKAAGARILRGGAYKPRTSPYAFQGLGLEGLKFLREAGDELDMPVITEVVDPRSVEEAAQYADILQIGARNMQNYNLLLEVGRTRRPIFLKRGLAAPVEELLMSAEYVMSQGNHQVILCERGIRTFETATRFTLDVGAVPVIQQNSHLPVFIDPSHAAGKRDFVAALARAGIAAGAHGIIVEVHSCPEKALCDGPQALLPLEFTRLMQQIRQIATAVGKTVD